MRYSICRLRYKGVSGSSWTDMGMIPGSGSLSIDQADTKNGLVRTCRLNAKLSREHPEGPSWISGDLLIQVTYDNGDVIQLGTTEMPVRLEVSGGEPMGISCAWQDAL